MATSALNPNAPIFVPSAYRQVEDFSDQWWDLVQSSPWFRDYWMRECFSDPELDPPSIQIPDFTLPEEIDNKNPVHDNDNYNDAASKDGGLDLVSLGWLKWNKPRGVAETPRYFEKAPRAVKVKLNPRPIQQPR